MRRPNSTKSNESDFFFYMTIPKCHHQTCAEFQGFKASHVFWELKAQCKELPWSNISFQYYSFAPSTSQPDCDFIYFYIF